MTKKEIAENVKNAFLKAQEEKKIPLFEISQVLVGCPEREERGDYTTNLALLAAPKMKIAPAQIAKILLKYLKKEFQKELKNKNVFKKIEVKEPGFINFWLSDKELMGSLQKVIQEKEKYGADQQNKKVVIDYSSPNIAKTFGIGHLRSTIIGQALYNIYKFLGWRCIGDNHLGDWGTQFGKLIVAIKKWNKKNLKELSVTDMEELYVKFHQEAETDSALLDEARKWFRKLERGDQEAKEIWKICVDVSLKNFERIYELLGVKIDYALGESFYEDKMKAIIEEAKNKGLTQESQGALVINIPGIKTPLMLLKSDKTTTYETRELATIKYRKETWSPDLIIWEVGADQKLHFQKCFKAAEMLGYGKQEQLVHIAHGLIRWSSGKFSTRKGDTIHLEDVLKESTQRAEALLEKSKTAKGISELEKREIIKQVGVGAVKYNDLSSHPTKDIIFDWSNILNLEGNSGPYLQYAAARCQSVLKKSKTEPDKVKNYKKFNKEEEMILRTIIKFPEIVQEAAEKFSPNLICNFAFNLAQKYNLFYEKHLILEAETKSAREFRLCLTKGIKQILENSLGLLGIDIPEKM